MSKSLSIAYTMKKKQKKASGGTVSSGDKEMNYSKGGDIKPITQSDYVENLESKLARREQKKTGKPVRVYKSPKPGEPTKEKHGPGYADGGDVVEPTPSQAGSGPQMIDCPHCGKGFSHGGEVANELGEGAAADEKPNEFDDLVLDDNLSEHYTGKNSGDEDNDDDIVKRAMKKRSK